METGQLYRATLPAARSYGPQALATSLKMQSLRSEAQRIFRDYSLSPSDYSEAVGQYVRLCLNGEDHNQKLSANQPLIEKILYAMECENVHHRPTIA